MKNVPGTGPGIKGYRVDNAAQPVLPLTAAPLTVKIARIDRRIPMPEYESAGAAGIDLRAFLAGDVSIPPLGRARIPTGLRLEIPEGFEGQVRPRSGLAFKFGITVLNSPGTIDSDYRGDLDVVLVNLGAEAFTVRDGDRVAQLVIAPVLGAVHVALVERDQLSATERGGGGFGSTGI